MTAGHVVHLAETNVAQATAWDGDEGAYWPRTPTGSTRRWRATTTG
jgi:hypothetical protein